MYNPISIRLQNFLSHTDTFFNFKKDVVTLIFGKNEDDVLEGADSNGSGKSALIEGITVALTGEVYRDITKDDIVQNGKKEAIVDFVLYNDFLKEELRIERHIFKKSAQVVNIFINGKRKDDLVSVVEADKFILEKIGITREDLLNFFIINQGNDNSFFTTKDTKQKEIISRFANYTIVNEVIKKIELERVPLVDDLKKYNSKLDTLIGSQEQLDILLSEEIEKAREDVKEITDSIKQEIISKQLGIDEYEQTIADNNVRLEDNKELLPVLEQFLIGFDDIKNKIKLEKDFLELIDNEILRNGKQIRKITLELQGEISCPKCSHSFISGSSNDVEVLRKELLDLEDKQKQCNKKLIETNKTISILKNELVDEEKCQSEIATVKRENRNYIAESEEAMTVIKRMQQKIKLLEQELEKIKNKISDQNNIQVLQDKIDKILLEILEVEKERDNIQEQIEEKDYWIFHLGKKGFHTFLANKCIKTIENFTNIFLQRMGSNLSVKINGYQKLASGELRDKIEVFIVKNGINEGRFGKYSGGQKERISLAGILTFHSLINNSLSGKGLGLLVLDESLDYLDSKGHELSLNILKQFNLTTLVITHKESEKILDGFNTVIVTYKNEESRI